MTISFIKDVQFASLATLVALLIYTLWLSRYRRLDTHVTVRWVLAQCVAILAVVLWQSLPFFEFTSKLQDRQLLLLVTVLVFAFVVFLMLDLLVRVSRQSVQIKKLVQELAIQRMRVDAILPSEAHKPCEAAKSAPVIEPEGVPLLQTGFAQFLFLLWLVGVAALNGLLLNEPLARWAVYEIAPRNTIERVLKPLLTAAYQK